MAFGPAPCALLAALILGPVPLASGAGLRLREWRRFDHVDAHATQSATGAHARAADPGHVRYRAEHLLGGPRAEGDFETDGNDLLEDNPWKDNSKAKDFDFLDDLEPVAPMDSVDPKEVSYWAWRNQEPLIVPAYLYPDAFPRVTGSRCNCQRPPPGSNASIVCDCKQGEAGSEVHWVKVEPVPNTNNFTLSPADVTYPDGNYFLPHIKGSIVAPEDRMPEKHYPLQAPEDLARPLPSTAREDRLNTRYARYIDQVEQRSRGCDDVSPECTNPCSPGDSVKMLLGNVQTDAKVLSVHVGNVATVELTPAAAKGATVAEACPLEASCTIFRPCRLPGSFCVERKDKEAHDAGMNLYVRYACPTGTTLCSTIRQVVVASFLRKDGKACRATLGR